jgi:hypothetical protein
MQAGILRTKFLRNLWPLALALVALVPATAFSGVEQACQGLVIETETGAVLDEGWTGRGHDTNLAVGGSTSWAIAKRCTAGDQQVCADNADCSAGTCAATCDCTSDTSCELAGPIDGRKCLANFADCTTNADCPASGACLSYFGPPQPVSYNDTPLCAFTNFEGSATGEYDSNTGDVSISGTLRRRFFLGSSASQPCPRCGNPDQDPQPGDQFTCEGGTRSGLACTVEGVTPVFGGTSFDCPPAAGNAVGGSGSVFRLNDLGTGTQTRTAGLQCTTIGFTGNPLVPGSNPRCTDTPAGSVCSSNADCKRCSGDVTAACANNSDCTGKGTCATSPDQPVTCGFWCHCGYCNNDGAQPCFETSDCSGGQTCQKGTGSTGSTNAPEQRPNDCTDDGFICGTAAGERCEDEQVASCSLAPYRGCESNSDCENVGAGSCVFEDKPCFESRITRTGTSTPLGKYCAFEDKTCTSNTDCTGSGDFCVLDASRAEMVGLYCLSSTSNSAINGFVGLAGPGAASLDAFVKVCRCNGVEPGCEVVCGPGSECGNGTIEEGEACDGGPCCDGSCALRATITVCRGAAGLCDIAESCNGSSSDCPGDTFAATTTACRASAGDCDVAESCSGSTADCPADGFAEDGLACDDGNACTTDTCQGGICEGTVIPECGAVCGDGTLDEGEACDDGNATFTSGEYCGVACVLIPCGKPTNSSGVLPKSGDALFALRAAVDQVDCSPRVCSPDGNQSVASSDALRILRAAVGQTVTLACPTE